MNRHIAIHSVPRSGSSWLGEIINSSEKVKYAFQPLFSYAFKSQLSQHSNRIEIEKFYRSLAHSDDAFVCQTEARAQGIKPIFEKAQTSHIAYKEVRYHYILENLLKQNPNQKVIGLIRHPLAVLSSWKAAPREFRTDLGWDFSEQWRDASNKNQSKPEEYFGFQKWKEVALLFKDLVHQFPTRFKLVHYSDLLADTQKETELLFEFLELEFSEQSRNFVESATTSSSDDSYSVFKSKQGIENTTPKNLSEPIIQSVINECELLQLSEMLR